MGRLQAKTILVETGQEPAKRVDRVDSVDFPVDSVICSAPTWEEELRLRQRQQSRAEAADESSLNTCCWYGRDL